MSQMQSYVKNNVLKVSSGVANAVFVTVGVGYLLEIFGDMLGIPMLILVGQVAKVLLTPALGAGIAVNLKANTLTIFSAMAAAALGGGAIQIVEGGMTIIGGEPIGALLAGTIATFVGKKVTGKTPLDMMAIPVSSLVVGGLSGVALAQVMTPLLTTISTAITQAVAGSPIVGSSVLAVVFGLFLMSPASSAALSVALALDPMSSGAMLIGTTAQYFAFSLLSMRENDLGGYIAQGVCTPKVQLPNIINNPAILIGPTVASAICGPLATVLFGFETIPAMGGMGFAALVAPLYVLSTNPLYIFGIYLLCGAVLPVLITYGVNKVLYARKTIKKGDMALTVS